MAPKTKNQRIKLTRYFVPHSSSSWFLKGALLTVLLAWGFFSLTAGYYHEAQLKPLEGFPALDDALHAELVRAAVRSTSVVLGAASVAFLLFCMYSLHRIAGPLYRLERHMVEVMEGKPPAPLSFREGDRFQDLCLTYNAFLVHAGLIEAPKLGEAAEAQDAEAGDALRGEVPTA